MRRPIVIFAAAAILAGVVSGCQQEAQLYVSNAWVRLGAVKGRPAAAYFVVHGGPTDATLLSVSTDVAIKSEMHETKAGADGKSMTMAAIATLPIPARAAVPFAPGGRHLMLFDVNPGIKPGATMTFTFAFANGLRIQKDAQVIAAGDPAPK